MRTFKKLLFIVDQSICEDPEDAFHTYWELYCRNRIDVIKDKAKICSITDFLEQQLLFRLQAEINAVDEVYFDYGGFMYKRTESIRYWNRFFISLMEHFQSKDWFCISMVDTFLQKEIRELEEQYNVKFIRKLKKYPSSELW